MIIPYLLLSNTKSEFIERYNNLVNDIQKELKERNVDFIKRYININLEYTDLVVELFTDMNMIIVLEFIFECRAILKKVDEFESTLTKISVESIDQYTIPILINKYEELSSHVERAINQNLIALDMDLINTKQDYLDLFRASKNIIKLDFDSVTTRISDTRYMISRISESLNESKKLIKLL